MTVHLHEEDLPAGDLFAPGAAIAVDTETMGLITPRDRLCVVQLSDGGADEHLVRFGPGSDYAAPNLKALLGDPARLKLYHFGRFDIAALGHYLGIVAARRVGHQDRVAADPYLHRSARAEGAGQGAARAGPVEAAAVVRLGRAGAVGRAEGLRRVRRALPPSAQGGAGAATGARGADGARAGVLRLPADAFGAGPGRLARDRYLRACLRCCRSRTRPGGSAARASGGPRPAAATTG